MTFTRSALGHSVLIALGSLAASPYVFADNVPTTAKVAEEEVSDLNSVVVTAQRRSSAAFSWLST